MYQCDDVALQTRSSATVASLSHVQTIDIAIVVWYIGLIFKGWIYATFAFKVSILHAFEKAPCSLTILSCTHNGAPYLARL